MYFAKFALLAASLVPAAVAVDLGTWDFYCGSSCSNGTLIASGDVNYGSFVECEGLAEAYEYCYLECSGVCSEEAGDRWFLADLWGSSNCNSASGAYADIQPGECAEGPFSSYWIKLNL